MRQLLPALFLALASAAAVAQEDAPAPPPAAPRPALMAAKATKARLLDVTLAGPQLVAVGEEGVILRSEDGRSWTQSPSPINAMLTRVRFDDARHGWVLGYDGAILHTDDGGASWSLRHFDPSEHALYDILFLDAQHGIAVGGYGVVLETRDGGANWSPSASGLGAPRLHLNALLRLPDGSLFAVGEHGLMARSTDAGASWRVLDSPYEGSLFGALPRGERGVMVYGMRGNVFEGSDLAACPAGDIASWDPDAHHTVTAPDKIAALGWRKIGSPSLESIFGTAQLADRSLLLLGVNGTVLRQASPGAALVPVKTPAVETLVHAVNFNGRIIAVGRQGIQDLGVLP